MPARSGPNRQRSWSRFSSRATSRSSNGARSPWRCSIGSPSMCAAISRSTPSGCRWSRSWRRAPGSPAARLPRSAAKAVGRRLPSRAMERFFESDCRDRDIVMTVVLGEKPMSLPHSIHVVSHPLVQHKLTKMRDKETSSTNFRRLLREMGLLLGYDATRDLPLVERDIATPIESMKAPLLEGKKLVVVPILRAGLGLAEGIIDLVPLARMGHVGLYRDPRTLQAVEYYFRIQQDISDRDVIVCDPMLATAHSAIAAVDRLKESGAKRIKFICILGSEPGARAFAEVHPDVPVFAAAIDAKLNDHGYIVPGLGDAGDRLFGTK